MTTQITALQVEALETDNGPVQVTGVFVAVSRDGPDPKANVMGLTTEVSNVTFNPPARITGEAVEVVLVKQSELHVTSAAVEVLHDALTQAHILGTTVEVLRSVTEKKRRPPKSVIAN